MSNTISLFFVAQIHRSYCPCCQDTEKLLSGPFISIEQARESAKSATPECDSELVIWEQELDPRNVCEHRV